ncbi:MAG TPA: hypothetical protein H9861_00255 [Candidatus Ligilactobacillus excrementigallinarum]|uniref:Holin n=1 Tax=Candidatus Ligilactobacillus excrementigallinarum TaxID=2838641 RepID=A0A9D1UVE3_9LACO|nr:hypothetical protein [Candidatus Ligilactobacillus excrementigallinarum]
MPHQIFGFGWDELASIVAVFSTVFGVFIGWLVHTVNSNFAKNSKPIHESIDKLTDVITGLKYQLLSHQQSIQDIQNKAEKNEESINDHEARLKILEKEEEDKK